MTPGASSMRTTDGSPLVIVPVLSSTTAVSAWACSSAAPSRMRMPFSAPLPGADHDRGRRGQAHGAGAGDDEDRDRRRQGEWQARLGADEHPARRTSMRRDGQHGRARTSRSRGRPRAGSGPSSPGHARRGATICDSAVSRPTRSARMTKEPERVHRRADDPVAGRLLDRQRLAGEHRLVDRGRAVDQHAVDRNAIAWADAHEIADHDLVEREPRARRRRAGRGRSRVAAEAASSRHRRPGPWPAPRAIGRAGRDR